MKWTSVVGDAIFFSPGPLLVWGWVKSVWMSSQSCGWRQNIIKLGLGAASVSSLCLYAVVLYLQKAHVGYWNEYLIASRWGRFCWPLSAAAVILGAVGKGASRVLLTAAGLGLVVVWTIAFVH